MKNRIQKYVTERTTMLSGVSHDLRTPLTRMKLQLSMMPDTDTTQDLIEDVTEMENMLESYLSFARGEGKEQPEQINLIQQLENLIEKLRKTGQKIDFHSEQSITLTCRPNSISRAVMNLLTNAGRYAHHTRVSVGIYRNTVRIIIDDDGPGIPKKERASVFRPFTRLETSRNRHTGGIGLGLTIARDAALSHGGDIYLADSPMGGLRAVITLPTEGIHTVE
jgi:two-component system osmolarity sensor histidine kinase EnvZ